LQKPRNIDSSKESFISPTDSIITEFGITKYSTAMQIKGKSYDIQELLTDKIDQQNLKNKLEDGHYLNFYLSPRDYHHFHLPTDAKITKVIHVPGALYPVNYTALNRKKDLFNKNERVILECITPENKLYYFVLVGALNVGQIILNFEPEFNTNVKNNKNISVKNYENLNIKKGEDIGYFAMGSTVVIISEKEFLEVEKNIFTGIKVSFGEKIATIL
jgi:phosphatidylserine decarboxylase